MINSNQATSSDEEVASNISELISQDHKEFQQWLNTTYGFHIRVTGRITFFLLPYIIKAMQIEIGSIPDGHWEISDQKLYVPIGMFKDNSYNKVKLIQALLCYKGYWNCPIDGIFNEILKSQIVQFQKDHNIMYDGNIGLSTINILMTKFGKRKGRIIDESCRETETREEFSQGGDE